MPKSRAHILKALIFTLALPLTLTSALGSTCLILGDSQSALSIEKKSGLVSELEKGLKGRGMRPVFYALKGVGASDWIISPKENRNTILGRALKNAPDQLLPFTQGGHNIALNQTGSTPFIDQLWKHHSGVNDDDQEKIDCFMIQLGDNDLFRDDASNAISEIVKHIKGKNEAPRTCRILGPSFKEKGARDQYPFITDQKKSFYMTKLRHRLQKDGLLESCPLVDGLNSELQEQLSNLEKPFTLDGLYFNKKGGELWAQSILKEAQL